MQWNAEVADHLIGRIRQGAIVGVAAGNHQRDARFVDQDGIDLVDHGGGKRTLHLLVQTKRQAVAQKIEADLVGGGVRDVAGVGGAALGGGHALLQIADREAQKAVDVAHPGSVAAGQIIVDGHDVDALRLTRVPGHGRNGGQRLSFAGLHFGDAAARQRQRPAKLDIEHVLAQHARSDDRGGGEQREQVLVCAADAQFVIAQTGKIRRASR